MGSLIARSDRTSPLHLLVLPPNVFRVSPTDIAFGYDHFHRPTMEAIAGGKARPARRAARQRRGMPFSLHDVDVLLRRKPTDLGMAWKLDLLMVVSLSITSITVYCDSTHGSRTCRAVIAH